MKIKHLIYSMVLMTYPLCAMQKHQYSEYIYDASQEQQTWVSQLQKEYQKKYRIPVSRETRKMKNMWRLIPVCEQQKVIALLNQEKIVTSKSLHKNVALSISDSALTKKYDQEMTLVPYDENLITVTINKKGIYLAKKNLSSTNIAKMLILLQAGKIDKQIGAGRKLTTTLDWMTKTYIENAALQQLDTDAIDPSAPMLEQ